MEHVAAARGPVSFELAVLPHRDLLRRVARRLTGSAVEAEDLVQDTLLRAFRAYRRLRPDSQIRPWLLRILRNSFINSWRRQKREGRVLQPTECEHAAPWLLPRGSGERPDEAPLTAVGDEVWQALEDLPLVYRQCVVLIDIQGKTYKETAELTGSPMGTVMSRLHRGRRFLQGKLQAYARTEGYLAQAA